MIIFSLSSCFSLSLQSLIASSTNVLYPSLLLFNISFSDYSNPYGVTFPVTYCASYCISFNCSCMSDPNALSACSSRPDFFFLSSSSLRSRYSKFVFSYCFCYI